MSKVICKICPHHCALEENQVGICRARSNINENDSDQEIRELALCL